MNKQTLQTITRHLKGIVAAIEKESQPEYKSYSYEGVMLRDLTNNKLEEAYKYVQKYENIYTSLEEKQSHMRDIFKEGERRGYKLK